MRHTHKDPNANLRSYYPVIFEGGLIILLLIMLVLTKINLGENPEKISLVKSDLVQLSDIVPSLQSETPDTPPRPVVPQRAPIAVIIEEVITDQSLMIEMDAAEKFIPAIPERPTASVVTPEDVIINDPVPSLRLDVEYTTASFTFTIPGRPVLPAELPVDIILVEPITGLQIPAELVSMRPLPPPHPTIPAQIPVDVIIPDPITNLDIKMDSQSKPRISTLLPKSKFADFAW